MLNAKCTWICWIQSSVSRKRICILGVWFIIQLWSRNYKVLNVQVSSDSQTFNWFTVSKMMSPKCNDPFDWEKRETISTTQLLLVRIASPLCKRHSHRYQTKHLRWKESDGTFERCGCLDRQHCCVMLDDEIKRRNENSRVCFFAWNSFLYRSLPVARF